MIVTLPTAPHLPPEMRPYGPQISWVLAKYRLWGATPTHHTTFYERNANHFYATLRFDDPRARVRYRADIILKNGSVFFSVLEMADERDPSKWERIDTWRDQIVEGGD